MFRNLFEDNDFSAQLQYRCMLECPLLPAPPSPSSLVAYICIVISAFYVSPDCCGDLPFVVGLWD